MSSAADENSSPVPVAILSDVHANLQALRAVVEDIAAFGLKRIYCLGDIVGYGPNPKECLDEAMKFDVTIVGNHDEALLFESEMAGFNERARSALAWTRYQLESVGDTGANETRWNFLGSLARKHRNNGTMFVHGSPQNPVRGYLFPDLVRSPERVRELFSVVGGLCFVGHTHVPGVITQSGQFLPPGAFSGRFRPEGEAAVVNVGSVGQSRDGDPRACYVVFDGSCVIFRRVRYDVAETQRLIRSVPELDNALAHRLSNGQ